MNWLAPLLGAGVAAVAIPALLVLYFLKLRRKEVDVSTTLLWKKTIHDMQANAPFQRLRRNLLLYLQLLALILAILAIAQPTFSSGSVESDRVLILIDRSGSMSATDGGSGVDRSRLDVAKRRALAVVDSVAEPGPFSGGEAPQFMVVAYDAQPAVVQSFTSNRAAVKNAIEGISPSSTPTMIADAMTLVRPYIDPRPMEGDTAPLPGADAHLFSDGRIADLADARLHPDAAFTFHSIGARRGDADDASAGGEGAGGGDAAAGAAGRETSPTNVGVVALAAERPFNDPTRVDIFARLINTALRPVTVDVQLQIDGGGGDLKEMTIPAASPDGDEPGSNGIVFSLNRTAAAVCTIAVLDEDVLAADNTAHLVIPPSRRLRLALVAERPNPFLQSVLEAGSPAELDTLTPEGYRDAIDAGRHTSYDLVVLDGVSMKEAPIAGETEGGARGGVADAFPAGRYLVFDAAPAFAGIERISDRRADDVAVVVESRREHPVLRVSPIDDVRAPGQRLLTVGPPAEVLARSSEGPLVVEALDRDARAIVVAFDPTRTNWFLEAGFVVFVLSAIDYLVADDPTLSAGSLRTGEIVSIPLPEGAGDPRLERPTGGDVRLQLTPDGRVNVGPLEQPGVYRLSWDGPPGPRDTTLDNGRAARLLPVNLLDQTESMLAPVRELTFDTTAVAAASGSGAEPERDRRLWPWLLVATLVIMLVEWWLYNRRVYM